MSKHTAGDWQIGQQGYVGINRDDARNWKGVCQVLGYGPEHEANAHLIAAAPQLLDALQVAELYLRERGLRASSEYKQIEAALAKATSP